MIYEQLIQFFFEDDNTLLYKKKILSLELISINHQNSSNYTLMHHLDIGTQSTTTDRLSQMKRIKEENVSLFYSNSN